MKYLYIVLIATFSITPFVGCSSSSNNGNDPATDLGGTADAGEDASPDEDVSQSNDTGVEPDSTADASQDVTVDMAGPFGGDRPATVVLPSDYDETKSYPLVFLLHGYGATGEVQDAYLGLSANVTARQFVLVTPDGTVDGSNKRFWNATPACCDFAGTGVDDQTYLMGLVDEAEAKYSIDPKAIYFMGHSNGGFMSYTLACEFGDRIAGIASLAGSSYATEAACPDTGNVSVLQIHGTDDQTITYAGTAGYPGALALSQRWADRNGADATPVDLPNIDFDTGIAGDETTVMHWANGDDGTDVTLWSIETGSHIPPGITTTFAPAVLDHLLARPKP